MTEGSQTFLQLLQLGAPASYLLLLLSMVSVTLIILKIWEFYDQRVSARDDITEVLGAVHHHDFAYAQALLGQRKGVTAQVLWAAVAALGNPHISREQAQEFVRVIANEKLENLKHLLRPLEVIGQLAPLTGLLGTVLGMITAFQGLQLAGESVSPADLSGGIWEALLTTAGGIAVALPSITAVHALERAVERLQVDLEGTLTRMFTPPIALPGDRAATAPALISRARNG